MEEKLVEFAPIVVVLLGFLWQYRIFVTPDQLERKHREILEDCERKFTTQAETRNFEEKLEDMQHKIDMIYDKLIG